MGVTFRVSLTARRSEVADFGEVGSGSSREEYRYCFLTAAGGVPGAAEGVPVALAAP